MESYIKAKGKPGNIKFKGHLDEECNYVSELLKTNGEQYLIETTLTQVSGNSENEKEPTDGTDSSNVENETQEKDKKKLKWVVPVIIGIALVTSVLTLRSCEDKEYQKDEELSDNEPVVMETVEDNEVFVVSNVSNPASYALTMLSRANGKEMTAEELVSQSEVENLEEKNNTIKAFREYDALQRKINGLVDKIENEELSKEEKIDCISQIGEAYENQLEIYNDVRGFINESVISFFENDDVSPNEGQKNIYSAYEKNYDTQCETLSATIEQIDGMKIYMQMGVNNPELDFTQLGDSSISKIKVNEKIEVPSDNAKKDNGEFVTSEETKSVFSFETIKKSIEEFFKDRNNDKDDR